MLIVLWLIMEYPDGGQQTESSSKYLLHDNLITLNKHKTFLKSITVNLIAPNTLSFCEKYSCLGITNKKDKNRADTGMLSTEHP